MFILVTSLFIFFLTWSWEYQLFFSRNLWRFLFIMVLVVYSLQDSCCLLTISLSRHRHDIPEFCLFTVTRFACEVDQSANSGIWVSSLVGHYHNWTSCWWLCFFFFGFFTAQVDTAVLVFSLDQSTMSLSHICFLCSIGLARLLSICLEHWAFWIKFPCLCTEPFE